MENEALTMRRLRADDLFTMMRILSKIGVNDLRSVMPTKTAIQRVREGSESAESLGVTVALMIADKLLARLPDCKAEIYTLLADLSGKTPAEIAALAPLSVRHSKRVLNDDGAYEEQGEVHKDWFDQAWGSQDVIEAQVARVQKRTPRFRGA